MNCSITLLAYITVNIGFNGLRIPSQFMVDTLNGNHFPNMHVLPDGRIFVSANQQAMILDWKTNTETRLPGIPNGVRISSPFSAGAVLLPLTPANNFTPEIMICGGSTVSDRVNPSTLSSQTPASDQCARLVLTTAGIAAGWKVERMPQTRIFVELVLLPDGRVLLVNGARTGVAGYGNVSDRGRGRTKTRSLTQSAIGRQPNRPKQRRQPNSHSSCVRSQRSGRTKILVRRYPCVNHPQNVPLDLFAHSQRYYIGW